MDQSHACGVRGRWSSVRSSVKPSASRAHLCPRGLSHSHARFRSLRQINSTTFNLTPLRRINTTREGCKSCLLRAVRGSWTSYIPGCLFHVSQSHAPPCEFALSLQHLASIMLKLPVQSLHQISRWFCREFRTKPHPGKTVIERMLIRSGRHCLELNLAPVIINSVALF